MKKNEGLSIHCHHEILIEYCTDYKGRVAYIESYKPIHEQKIRLKLFRLLPQKAINDLPKYFVKANADWQKANADWQKANADWQKADAYWQKADADCQKAYADWPLDARKTWHDRWCGCEEWNGMEIIFNGQP